MSTAERMWMPRKFIDSTGIPSPALTAPESAAVVWADIAILRMLGHCIGHRVAESESKPKH